MKATSKQAKSVPLQILKKQKQTKQKNQQGQGLITPSCDPFLCTLHCVSHSQIHLYHYSSTKKDHNKKLTSTVPIGNSVGQCVRHFLRYQPTPRALSATLQANHNASSDNTAVQRERLLLMLKTANVTRLSLTLQKLWQKHQSEKLPHTNISFQGLCLFCGRFTNRSKTIPPHQVFLKFCRQSKCSTHTGFYKLLT